MEHFESSSEIVWRPSPEILRDSNLKAFMDRHGLKDLDELMHRSTEDVAWFWDAVMKDLDIQFYEPYETVVDLSAGYPWPRWCVGGKMNIVHNCLDKWIGTPTQNRVAIRWEGEEGVTRLLTYRDLWREVNRTANALRALGLGKGDAIGLYMPMIPEIAIALFAIAKIGAVILPLFSGFGSGAIAARLADAGARALFTADGTYRRGKAVPMKVIADEALREVPSVEHVIVYPRIGAAGGTLPDQSWVPGRDHWWDELVSSQPATAETERTSAEDLLMIIYTSGTTGRPKGAVHTHCSFPIKGAQDMYHNFDIKSSDTMYWMTDMGWMMGPWEVLGMTLLGGTFVLYDGAPDYPDVDRTWAMIERHGVTLLGLSPTFVRAVIPYGEEAVRRHDLSSLRAIGSTGEPWNPDPWLWTFQVVGGSRIPIINYSGGTEVSGGILCGNLLTPLKPCAFSGPVPGIAAEVVDDEGRPVRNQVGELVIRKPWIGMTRGFWKDPERYIQTYWSRFPNMWVHGDWAAIDEDGLWYILGRSDDVIKVAGKRLGPAEVESVVVSHPAVVEAAAIGVPDATKGQAVVVFAVLKSETDAADALREELKNLVAAELGKPLAPKEIKFVRDLPKTRNAKLMRRMIRAAYLGQEPGDTSALVNPEAVEGIRHAL